MRKNNVNPVAILGVLVVLFSISSWFLYPTWQERPYGLFEMIVIVAAGTTMFLDNLLSIIRNSNPNQNSKAITDNTVSSGGDRSIAIGGSADNASLNTGDSNSEQPED